MEKTLKIKINVLCLIIFNIDIFLKLVIVEKYFIRENNYFAKYNLKLNKNNYYKKINLKLI